MSHIEKQRSFSIKPTRFLVFSFTISFFVTFLIFFSIWVSNASLPIREKTNFLFGKSSLGLIYKPLAIQSLTGFGRNSSASEVSNSNFADAKVSEVSSSQGLHKKVSRDTVPDSEISTNAAAAVLIANSSASSVNSSTLVTTPVRNPEITTGLVQDSVQQRLLRKDKKSRVPEKGIYERGTTTRKQNRSDISSKKRNVSLISENEGKSRRSCNIAKGKWILDESYPLYTNFTCPFIDEGFNCQANGRLDNGYMKWRWQPQDCDIPRFNATRMLELIRGKRLIFVGDSLNRNQWESMLCLLMGAIKDPKKVYETRGRRITKEKGNYSFKFVDFKCTVEFYATHFLVRESKARVGKRRVQTLRIDAIDKGSSRWKGADILVFNTAHWWNHYKTKSGVNYYQEGDLVHPYLEASTAFRQALTTWASWVDKHINPRKTQVFYRSSAPSHFRGGQWNAGGHCQEASQPLSKIDTDYPERNMIVEEVLRQMQTPVTLLNITSLSDYRIDGHPSIYGRNSANRKSSGGQDCSHWCLPGVPDAWNQFLYFHLQLPRGRSSSH